jgi:hypothetical protein
MNASKVIRFFFLLTAAFLFWGCASTRGSISVPMDPDISGMRGYKRIPVKVGLFVSQENKFYAYKGTPSPGSEFPTFEHSFPLGKALETISLRVFSQYFREVNLVRTRPEGENFKVLIEPEIEEFAFHYGYLTKGGGSSTFEYVVPTVVTKVKVTLYGDGKRIGNKSMKSSAQKEFIMLGRNYNYEKGMGEVASQALIDAVSRIAEELSMDPAVENYLEAIAPESPKK